MLDRLIVRPIPQGSGVAWLIEPAEGSPGGAPGLPGSSGLRLGPPARAGDGGERDETIRALREQVAFLLAEVQDRKRELRAEQEARRREVGALHELLALAGARDGRREDEGRQEDEGRREGARPPVPPPVVPVPPDGPAPGPGSGAAAAPAGSWWRRVLGRREDLP